MTRMPNFSLRTDSELGIAMISRKETVFKPAICLDTNTVTECYVTECYDIFLVPVSLEVSTEHGHHYDCK
jgi:hypothetical protein